VYDTGWQNVTNLIKTLQMCTVNIDSGLGYKSSQVQVRPAKMDFSPDLSPSPDSGTTSLGPDS